MLNPLNKIRKKNGAEKAFLDLQSEIHSCDKNRKNFFFLPQTKVLLSLYFSRDEIVFWHTNFRGIELIKNRKYIINIRRKKVRQVFTSIMYLFTFYLFILTRFWAPKSSIYYVSKRFRPKYVRLRVKTLKLLPPVSLAQASALNISNQTKMKIGFLGQDRMEKRPEIFEAFASENRDNFEFFSNNPETVNSRYISLPKTSDVEAFIDDMDFIFYCSVGEGFGLPPFEAVQRGKVPIIVSNGVLSDLWDGYPLLIKEQEIHCISAIIHSSNIEKIFQNANDVLQAQQDLKREAIATLIND